MRRACLLITLLVLTVSACQPGTDRSTPLPAPVTAVVTDTPAATASPTAIPPTPTPAYVDHSLLTPAQKQRLYENSLKYIAPTQEEANRIARGLQFVQGDGDASNMCGPLAIAQLRDAGLVDRYVEPHDFWLLRPNLNIETIRTTFPERRYEKFHFDQSIRTFDFHAFPLETGDFVYLYADPADTFEHMLTVTRVDDQGRPWTVTNLLTADGRKIEEVMLYDPKRPNTGQFYDWTDRHKRRVSGMTGDAGFDVWRLTEPVVDPTPAETALADGIDQALPAYGGNWNILIRANMDHTVYSLHASERIHVASIIKVPIAMLFFKSLEKEGIQPADYANYLPTRGIDRTYQQLLTAMLVASEEDATETLWGAVRKSGLDVQATLEAWGAYETDIPNRQSTLDDIASLYEKLYFGGAIDPEGRRILLELLGTYTSSDDTRLGVLRASLPVGAQFYNKRGTITEERLVIGDSALYAWPQDGGEKVYVVIALGYPGNLPTNDVKLVQGIEAVAKLFWQFAMPGSP
jgi:hypothetical protein